MCQGNFCELPAGARTPGRKNVDYGSFFNHITPVTPGKPSVSKTPFAYAIEVMYDPVIHRSVFMAKDDSQIEKLGAILDKSLKRFQASARLDEYEVWPIWNEVVGDTIARNAQPERIRNGTLLVKVTSPVWMQQLQYMKEMISEKLNQRLRTEAVKNIFFVIGTIDSAHVVAEEVKKATTEAEPLEPKIDDDFLASLPDGEVREAFTRLMKSHYRRNRKE